MTKANNQYIYGSAVEKVEYDVYEENKVLKAKKIHKQNRKVKLKMVFNVMLLFALSFAVIYRYAIITELSYEIDKLGKEYESLLEEKSVLEFELEKGMNLATVEDVATNKLGMVRPDKNQVIGVSVPKTDYTVAAVDEKSETDKQGLFESFLYKINSFASLLY